MKSLERLGVYFSFIFDILISIVRRPPKWALIREQLYEIGVMSTAVIALTGFTTGFVLAAQSFYQLGEKGLSSITGVLVAKSMITELGPILAAFMVTGRVGSSMCAEIGSMKVTEQIDALRSMAINPNSYLVAPRLIAGAIMVPCLTLFCTFMGVFGGYLLSVCVFDLSSAHFFQPMPIHISCFDLASCLIKSMIFGILLITVCCFKGLHASGGAAGVGRATTQSVVTTYILILLFDLLLTLSLHRIHSSLKVGWLSL